MKISVNVEIEMTEKETEMYIKEDNNMYKMKQIRDQIKNEINRQYRYNAIRNNK